MASLEQSLEAYPQQQRKQQQQPLQPSQPPGVVLAQPPLVPYYNSPAPSFSFSTSSTMSTSPSPTSYTFSSVDSGGGAASTSSASSAQLGKHVANETAPVIGSKLQQQYQNNLGQPPSSVYAGYSSQIMVQQPSAGSEAVYTNLPTYRFPPLPRPLSSSTSSSVATATPKCFSKPAHLQLPISPHVASFDATQSGSPVLSPSLSSANASETRFEHQSGLQPPLPIISLPQSLGDDFDQSHVRSNSMPSGMVHGLAKSTSSERSYDYDGPMSITGSERSESPQLMRPIFPGTGQLDGLGVMTTPPKASGSDHLGIHHPSPSVAYRSSYPPPPEQPFGYHYSTSSTTHTTSTFVPSSAYLPSKSHFAGMSPQVASMPRSAPSTPLGRQDARFLSQLRNQSSPQPAQTGFAAPAGSPRFRPSPHMSAMSSAQISQAPSMQSWYSQDENYGSPSGSIASGQMGGSYASSSYGPTGHGEFGSTSYIPYASSPGLSSLSKRLSPFSLQSPPTAAKKPRRAGTRAILPKPEAPGSGPSSAAPTAKTKSVSAEAESSASPAASVVEEKPKVQRSRIACGACRKTRLKCDGKHPCTSCIDKHQKQNVGHSEELAIQLIEQEQRCVYETFVRRRGKGKKTIEKERDELLRRSGFQLNMSTNSNSSYASGIGGSELGVHPHMDAFDPGLSTGYYDRY